MVIIIDPRIMYNYATYYLYGIKRLFSQARIKYDITPFGGLTYHTIDEYRMGFPMIFDYGELKWKVFIDINDRSVIKEDCYVWADLYAKINIDKDDLMIYKKLFAIGPGFGINEQNVIGILHLFFMNMVRSRGETSVPIKTYLRDYLYPIYRREKYSLYESEVVTNDNYVFHASTLWYDRRTDSTTNKYRGDFLICCKDLGIEIDGGLFYINDPVVLKEYPEYVKYLQMYKDFLITRRISMKEYIIKTKRSFVVFNTPSVGGCHGWKLAEYLCMGKAIISTPLTREMPGRGLVHGDNIHIVNTNKDLYDAVELIRDNPDYRKKLEKGARSYFDEYLSPSSVIQRIIDKCNDLGHV